MVDRSKTGSVKSCAYRMHRDFDKRFSLGGRGAALNREVEYVCQQH